MTKKAQKRIRDCMKEWTDGAFGKCVAPSKTLALALSRIRGMSQPILDCCYKIDRPSGIPEFAFLGTQHFRQYGGRFCGPFSYGKGHTRDQALASAVMEMVERFSCSKYFAPHNPDVSATCSFADLEGNLFQAEDFFSMLHGRVPPRGRARRLVRDGRLAFYRGQTLEGQEAYLPMGFLAFFNGTNGMAAGNSLEEALLQAICEVIERDRSRLIRLHKPPTPTIDVATIDNPVAQELLVRFRMIGSKVCIRDFSQGIGLPAIGVVRALGRGRCILTTGVATSPSEALVRALTENSQAETHANIRKVSQCRHLFAPGPVVALGDLPNVADVNMKTELRRVQIALKERSMQVFFVDTTDEELGIPCVAAVVSGAKAIVHTDRPYTSCLLALLRECTDSEDLDNGLTYVGLGKRTDSLHRAYYSAYEGLILAHRRRYRRAIERFREAFKQARHGDGWLESLCLPALALCHEALADRDLALDACARLREANPEFCFDWLAPYWHKPPKDTELLERVKALHSEVLARRMQGTVGVRLTEAGMGERIGTRELRAVLHGYGLDRQTGRRTNGGD